MPHIWDASQNDRKSKGYLSKIPAASLQCKITPRRFCQTLSVNANPQDLFDQPLLLDMIFLGTPQLCGGVHIFFTKCPLRNTLMTRHWLEGARRQRWVGLTRRRQPEARIDLFLCCRRRSGILCNWSQFSHCIQAQSSLPIIVRFSKPLPKEERKKSGGEPVYLPMEFFSTFCKFSSLQKRKVSITLFEGLYFTMAQLT